MIPASFALFAQEATQTSYVWRNAQSNVDLIVPGLLFLAAAAFVVYMYRRDAAELSPLWAVLLTTLRTATFVALLILYLYPQRRNDEDKTYTSRVLLLVDVSRSMGLPNAGDYDASKERRIDRVVELLRGKEFLNRLRETHEVMIVPFDDELRRDRAVTLAKFGPDGPPEGDEMVAVEAAEAAAPAAVGEDKTAAGDETGPVDAKPKKERLDWAKRLAISDQNRETRLGQALLQLLNEEASSPLAGVLVFSDGGQNAGPGVNRAAELASQSRTAIVAVGLGPDRPPPNVRVSGFQPPPRAYPGDPYTVEGYVQGSRMEGQTINVQLLSRPADVDLPGTGELVDAKEVVLGPDGEQVLVKFEVKPEEIGQRTLCLKAIPPPKDRDPNDNFLEGDTEVVDAKNRVLLLAGGPMRDYQYLCNLLYREIADKLLKGENPTVACDVYLQSGTPNPLQVGKVDEERVREYARVLDDFPETAKEMAEYDCVVAFDPDWQALTTAQIDVLEAWVDKQGGGLLAVAGPVYAGQSFKGWAQNKDLSKLRELYPVLFQNSLIETETSMKMGEQAWALQFEPAGRDASFLGLADTPAASLLAWQEFPGVYSYLPLRGAKRGATVLARFSDPREAVGEVQPPYMVWHNFGAGRVFYMGSGEMWRLRALDDAYLHRFYTKVMRFVSAGRLLGSSSRGMLLVEQERPRVGDTITVRGYRLADAQLQPLAEKTVALRIVGPDQKLQEVPLQAETGRPGFYTGQFTPLRKGPYRLRVDMPDGTNARLTANVTVEGLADLELDQPARNDLVLATLAGKVAPVAQKRAGEGDEEATEEIVREIVWDEKPAAKKNRPSGEPAAKADRPGTTEQRAYYVDTAALMEDTAALPPVFELLKDHTRKVPKPVIDRQWEESWLRWMMCGLFVLLCGEWLIRRLLKLA